MSETRYAEIAADELAQIMATARRLFAEWEDDCTAIRMLTGWDGATQDERDSFVRQAVREHALALVRVR
jgi:hypothetical protein